MRSPCARIDEPPGPWLPAGFDVVPQRDGPLAARLAGAFDDVRRGAARHEPVVLVGMDTPQLDVPLLRAAFEMLRDGMHDAVLGPAYDGGYWAVGTARPVRGAFRGVPMSTSTTCAAELARFDAVGLRTGLLAPLRDVDEFSDALAVVDLAPDSRFAERMRSMVLAGASR